MKCPKWLKQWICGEDRDKAEGTKADRDSRRALWCLALAIFIGLAVVVGFAFQTSSTAAGLGVLTTAVITAGAALMVGGTVGFIFGVPRTRPKEPGSENASGQGNESEQKKEGAPTANGWQGAAPVEGNTNLEEISDWLTKMLVGVGLIQLYKVPGQLKVLTSYVADGLKGPDPTAPLLLVPAEAFALGLIVYFLFVGFLFGYLWTRFVLTGALTRDALGRLRGQLTRQTERMLSAEEKTLNRVRQQLYAREAEVIMPQEELDKAIKAASPETKAGIFYEAARLRRETWRDDKPRMERTIPIFRALCHDDKENRYHANHGQLGFALKDKQNATPADYEEAERELTKAIEIRDRVRPGKVWPYYEFNRAICRIDLHRPVSDIEPDLRKAYGEGYFREIIDKDKDIKKWLTANKVPPLAAPQQP